MKDLKITLVVHLILGPIGFLIIANDAAHPEHWDTWYRKPATSIPYCIALDAVIWGMAFHSLWKELRFAKGIRLMAEANRLRAQGQYRAAKKVWQDGLRLTGQG
jgi:hypothetical protein